jgi:hypothetical protein
MPFTLSTCAMMYCEPSFFTLFYWLKLLGSCTKVNTPFIVVVSLSLLLKGRDHENVAFLGVMLLNSETLQVLNNETMS